MVIITKPRCPVSNKNILQDNNNQNINPIKNFLLLVDTKVKNLAQSFGNRRKRTVKANTKFILIIIFYQKVNKWIFGNLSHTGKIKIVTGNAALTLRLKRSQALKNAEWRQKQGKPKTTIDSIDHYDE